MNREYGANLIRSRSIHFANINANKEVWWFDIPMHKTAASAVNTLDLVVYDHRDDHLYHLRVPTEYIRSNLKDLVIRDDRQAISLELSAGQADLFRDVRPKGGGVQFRQFLVEGAGNVPALVPIQTPRETRPSRGTRSLAASRITGDELMKWHRELLRLLDSLDAHREPGVGPAARIRQLSDTGVIPRKIAALMRSLTEARNAAVHEGDEPTAAEAAAIEHTWNAISDWARTRRAGRAER